MQFTAALCISFKRNSLIFDKITVGIMKIKKGFTLRKIGNDEVVVPEGLEVVDFNKMVTLNSTASFLWRSLDGKEFDVEDAAVLLVGEYDVEMETALADCIELFEQWKQAGIIE